MKSGKKWIAIAIFVVFLNNPGVVMFRGVSPIQLDIKGRLAMPARYRGLLAACCESKLIATIDTEERCLLLYPLPAWEEIEQKLSNLPTFHPMTRQIQRLLMGHACDVEMDTHGRLLLPAMLREYAALEKAVVLVGQGRKFELWSESEWQSKTEFWLKQGLCDPDALPEELRSLSL